VHALGVSVFVAIAAGATQKANAKIVGNLLRQRVFIGIWELLLDRLDDFRGDIDARPTCDITTRTKKVSVTVLLKL